MDILAGPIVRRVTQNRVCIWLATNTTDDLSLKIYQGQDQVCGVSGQDAIQQFKVSDNLTVWLLQARPVNQQSFPKDEVLFYAIEQDEKEIPLDALALKGFSRPSFFIAEKMETFAHGSCRKPHGEAFDDNDNPVALDALSLLAGELDDTANNLAERPALICLTGDQVYADDVQGDLVRLLAQKATEIMGTALGVPGIMNPSELEVNGRINRLKSLTTDAGHNHLIGLGEFIAMYLFAFGNAQQWQLPSTQFAKVEQVKHFIQGLPEVRRALANIPVYTIFDDHEVTDDWNLSRRWYEAVRGNPTSRRLVSNALACYWLFQGWGNDPDNFHKDFFQSIRLHLDNPKDEIIGERFDLHMWKSRGWGYAVPTEPPIIAVDTRTQRNYIGKRDHAWLLDRVGADAMRMEWTKLQTRALTSPPILLIGTPVMGFRPIEFIQDAAYLLGVSKTTLDMESWVANKDGFAYFMDTLLLRMGLNSATFIAGDVHYSFVNKGYYEADGKRLNCIQLTSSALHNSPNKGKVLKWLAHPEKGKRESHKGWRPAFQPGIIKRCMLPLCQNTSTYPIWKSEVEALPMSHNEKAKYITSVPNFALIKINKNNGKPESQILISGMDRKQRFVFNLQ
ncbi:alkaline phosphatase D family protein [Pleionea sp. CnH1-48]|uniref:alkaline phosphatase D family protein n=1 Tax=Pleionea sp. CnH1-48 TaxID=2954494 RepID=UPI002097F6F6|nr:alkaline phosphatase D family protein [Pleionea sp. CnH1-48]MCO7225890.1 alkaline phosphatase D family protein [Pleionea sp. CnH1-48]